MAGRITDWNDGKGFGFVMPNGGGERAFVHISAFQRGSRRPIDGDLISYLQGKDSRGRLQARAIRHAGQKIEQRRQPSRLPAAALGIGAIVAVIGIAAIGAVPFLLAGAYLLTSALSYVMYRADKVAAGRGTRRTPESSLHLVDLLGGWPGALVAQQRFRHKTAKQSFQLVYWLTVALNLVVAWWLVTSGAAFELARSFGG